MSGRLVGETVDWLRTPAAAELTVAERCILLIIAERCHERSRNMLRHGTDEQALVDRLADATGLDKAGGLRRAFQKLAKRGLEVRVAVGMGRDGRPVFSHEGVSMSFRLPLFPASISIPERGDESPASAVSIGTDRSERGDWRPASGPLKAVDNPVSEAIAGGTAVPPLSPEGGQSVLRGGTERPMRGDESPPLIPLVPQVPLKDRSLFWQTPLLAEVEGCGQPAIEREIEEEPEVFDQGEYLTALGKLCALPDEGAAAVAQAAAERPDARREIQIIHAAALVRMSA